MKDVIIVGNGPAGLSAALYTTRANKSTLIIGKDSGALAKADKIENYFGFTDVISGQELVENGRRQAKRLGAEIHMAEVVNIAWNGTFTVETTEETYEAKAVILATGSSRTKAKIKGIDSLEGHGVSYCAVCDGFFYRGKTVGVLGDGPYALHEIQTLLPLAEKVVMLTNGKEVTVEVPDNVQVLTEPIAEILGGEAVEGLRFKDDTTLALDGLFVALGTAGADDLARKLGAQIKDGKIIVDEHMATMVPGLYAAGDCVGGLLQVSKAVGDGANAAMSVIQFLRKSS